MKIAFVCDSYYPVIGGTSKVATKLAEELAKNGHEVFVYTVAWDHNKRLKTGTENINNVRINRYRYLFKVGNYGTIWPQVFFKLMSEDYDIIHTHLAGHLHTFIATVVSILRRKKLIVQTHSPWGEEGNRSFMGKVFRFLSYNLTLPITFKKASKILCLTHYEDKYIKKYGGKLEKVIYFPNGIENYFINPNNKNNGNKERKVILFVGAFNEIKNPIEFIDICEDIHKKDNSYVFVMIGPDEGLKEEMIRRVGTKSYFKILPPLQDQKELTKIYRASDLLLITSKREAFGNIVIEAWASGLPVVASEVGGLKYLIQDSINGYLYKSGDISYASKLIIKIFNDRIKTNQMILKNKKNSQSYTWTILTKKLIDIYNN